MNDLLKVAAAPDPKSASSLADNTAAVSSKEPLCKQTVSLIYISTSYYIYGIYILSFYIYYLMYLTYWSDFC